MKRLLLVLVLIVPALAALGCGSNTVEMPSGTFAAPPASARVFDGAGGGSKEGGNSVTAP